MAEFDVTRWQGMDSWWQVEVEFDLDALIPERDWAAHREAARHMTNGLPEAENFEWIVAQTSRRLGL